MYNYKKLVGELFDAAIAVVWMIFALIDPGNMVTLVIATCLTILFGVLSGGFLKLSAETNKSVKTIEN